MASARSASLNGGLAQRGPGADEGSGEKLKAFRKFLYKKWPKVKDVSAPIRCVLRAYNASKCDCSRGGTTLGPLRPTS